MAFVTRVNLTEFRGIRECQKPLRLTKFNVLLGRNNSGKSAVLQALSLLPNPERGLPMNLNLGEELFKLRGGLFERKQLLHHLTGGPSSLVYKYTGSASLEFHFHAKKHVVITLDHSGNTQAIVESARVEPDAVLRYLAIKNGAANNGCVFVPNDSEFLAKVREKLVSEWSQVVKTGAHVKVAKELINPTVDEVFTEIFRDDKALKVRKEAEGAPYYVDIRDLGGGVAKALSIALFLGVCNPWLVLWDDFEAAAHPSLVRQLLSWLSQKDWQVVLATHSIDVLYELAELKPKQAQIIQVRKTAEDVLIHKTLTIAGLSRLLDAGIDPRLLVDQIR